MSERGAERIVVLTSSYPAHADDPSGHFVAADVARLRREGADVTVLAPRSSVTDSDASHSMAAANETTGVWGERVAWLSGGDAFGWPGVLERIRERPYRATGVLSFVRETRRALEARGPWDRLVAHFLVPNVWPVLDGLDLGARCEAVAHGSDVRLVGRLPGPLRRRIARVLDGFEVRCTSEALRRELVAALGSDGAFRARVELPPLDLPERPSRAEARQSLGIDPSARVLVVVGRLISGKRMDVALRAARLVPGACVVVIGDGPERPMLERTAPDASFLGRLARSRTLRWLAAADALIVASREEGAPSVVREARALGTPVVAAPCGDIRAWQANDPELYVVGTGAP